MATLKDEKVIDKWLTLVSSAAGKSDVVFDRVRGHLDAVEAPSVSYHTETVKPGLFQGLMGKKRDFLAVKNQFLSDHKMYIGARDYGTHLSVCWFLTCEPGYFKKKLSTHLTGSDKALSFALDLFDQEELNAYATAVHSCVKQAVKELMEELGQDFSKVNTKSKGFLEVW